MSLTTASSARPLFWAGEQFAYLLDAKRRVQVADGVRRNCGQRDRNRGRFLRSRREVPLRFAKQPIENDMKL
jgi:hypothetical protein